MTIAGFLSRHPRAAALAIVVTCRYINLMFSAAEHIEKHRSGALSCMDLRTDDPSLLAICATHRVEYNRYVPIEATRLMFSPSRHLADASESFFAVIFLGVVAAALVWVAMTATSSVAQRFVQAPHVRTIHGLPLNSGAWAPSAQGAVFEDTPMLQPRVEEIRHRTGFRSRGEPLLGGVEH